MTEQHPHRLIYIHVRCRKRLKLKPTPANLKKRRSIAAVIMSAIGAGTFDYQVTFPRSKNARKFLRKERLDNNLRN